jgi:ATP-dependent 26S proteasome regulatory subunit
MEQELTMAFIIDQDTPHGVGQPAFVEEGKTSKYKWLKSKEGVYAMVQDSETVDSIDPGMYSIFQDNRGGLHAQVFTIDCDELFELPDDHIDELITEGEMFWNKTKMYKKYNFIHSRGILLHGGGGEGKTTIVDQLAQKLVKRGGLVFFITNTNELMWYIAFMQDNLRVADPNREVIVIIEDIDTFCDGGGVERTILNWLNGADSINHQLVIATTNHYDELSDLLLRPGRFDKHIDIGKPIPSKKEAYLIAKGLDKERAHKWSKDTDGFSLAELKELFVAVILLDIDYELAKTKVNKQAAAVINNTSKRQRKRDETVGFTLGKK